MKTVARPTEAANDPDFCDASPVLAVLVALLLIASAGLAFFWPSAQHLLNTLPFTAN